VEKWKKSYCRNNFLSTSLCGKEGVFQQAMWKENERKVFNRYSFHIPQILWKNHRQELIFAVISRMLFCREVSLPFKATSTLRIP